MDDDEYRRRASEVSKKYRERKEAQRAARRAQAEAEASAEADRVLEDLAKKLMAEAAVQGHADPGRRAMIEAIMGKSPLEQLIHMDVMIFFIASVMIRLYKMQHPDA